MYIVLQERKQKKIKMSKLKPCPNCNREIIIKDLGLELNTFKIMCKTSGCLSITVGGGSMEEHIKIFNKLITKEYKNK